MSIVDPDCRWPETVLSPGPERIYDDNPKPPEPRRLLGFTNTRTESEPLLWNGDQA